MVKKIACFFTCGYTEAGGMQSFLKNINNHYNYIQFLPNKTIKKKGMPKNISKDISGLTGKALLNKIYKIIAAHKDEIKKFSAIIIEDDLDGLFHRSDEDEINNHICTIIKEINVILEKDMPVFVIYASPEIESWFIADWKNSFEYIYLSSTIVKDLEYEERKIFVYYLRKYINSYILKDCSDNIEEYGWFDDEYRKLSEEIQLAIRKNVKEEIIRSSKFRKELTLKIYQSKYLYYSKKLHGEKMLRNIDPSVVATKCRKYFFNTFNRLHYFNN